MARKTFLELIDECDNFPHPPSPAYTQATRRLYHFRLLQQWTAQEQQCQTVGYMLASVVERMPWSRDFQVNHERRTVIIPYTAKQSESDILAAQLCLARERDCFRVLRGWRDELYPVADLQDGRSVVMERAGSTLFGIHTFGVHMTAFTRTSDTASQRSDASSVSIWVPRRARSKSTYPGMLDNSVAGGIAADEPPFDSIVREAAEEASLPEDLVRARANAVGTISYIHVRDERAGGEAGLLQPETQYLYDLELPPDVVPKPHDDEVESFQLRSVRQVREAMQAGEFKPNCVLCLLDFMLRHGLLTAETEPDYRELVVRLHRPIVFSDKNE